MAEPFIGQIILVGFSFAPQGWAFCDGQFLPIAQNDQLFQLIGTTYGGDGDSTFRLPDLRGRCPIGPGQGSGLASYVLGDAGGTELVTVTSGQMPNHGHIVNSTLTLTRRCRAGGPGDQLSPVRNVVASDSGGGAQFSNGVPDANMHPNTITVGGTVTAAIAGGSQPHDNMQPSLCVNFCIALFGVYPS